MALVKVLLTCIWRWSAKCSSSSYSASYSVLILILLHPPPRRLKQIWKSFCKISVDVYSLLYNWLWIKIKKTYKWTHALQRIRRNLSVDKARLLANAFIDSQFNYAPLIWMFAGKTLINKICKIHHRTLQVVCDDFDESYDELLELNRDLSIHQRHLRYLAIEVFKSIMHLNPQFMWSYFEEKPMPYNLRDGSKLVLPKTNLHVLVLIHYDLEGVFYGIIYLCPLKTVKV